MVYPISCDRLLSAGSTLSGSLAMATSRHMPGSEGFNTIITRATSGVSSAARPQVSQLLYSVQYAVQDRSEVSADCANISIFRCSGPTLALKTRPEARNRSAGQRIQPVPRIGRLPAMAPAMPLRRIPNTPGMVAHRSLRMMLSNVDAI